MSDHRFAKPQTFSTGVQWNPTDYKDVDQAPYLAYLDKVDARPCKWHPQPCEDLTALCLLDCSREKQGL